MIRVVKRGRENNSDVTEAPGKPRVTTEMIVKSWIVESREQRRAAMSQLQRSFGWEQIGGLARG